MQWTTEADAALKKVPFFVRKRVRARIEQEVAGSGKAAVTLSDVNAAKARYISGMHAEVKGYQVETCFGSGGCPNRAVVSDGLVERLESLLAAQDLLAFLKARVPGGLKLHHEFRVAVADCPNACSQPQIRDIGIIGACAPVLTDAACTGCAACVAACAEQAVALDEAVPRPRIDMRRCLSCGKCIRACPTETLIAGSEGYRVQLGGRLGRHPRLARELPGIYAADQVIAVVEACLDFYKARSRHGERFAHLLEDEDFAAFARRFDTKSTAGVL
jgi:dissimilatory sulfite reductase (desulfoviridin) alpha/beta subunit